MENKYIFILDEKGTRVTSLLVGVHAETEEACIEVAKRDYPNHTHVTGGDEMQSQFIDYKCYIDGKFVEMKEMLTEEIAEAEAEREKLKEVFLTKQMKGLPTEDIKAQFKQIDVDLIKKIRELN